MIPNDWIDYGSIGGYTGHNGILFHSHTTNLNSDMILEKTNLESHAYIKL